MAQVASGGHLTAADVGIVINTNDAYSQEVGEYYIAKRHLSPEQVLRLELPQRAILSEAEFNHLKQAIDEHFGNRIQAVVLAWTTPYAVRCNSITGAMALGFDPALCERTCARSRPSPYFNSQAKRPYTDMGMRLAMLLAAASPASAKLMIDRGVAADRSLGWRGAPPANAYFVSTQDAARNVRSKLFPAAGLLRRQGVDVKVERADWLSDPQRVLIYQTGVAKVQHLQSVQWVNGALADHLTSFGGQLDKQTGQTTAMEWIESGATASYGTVTEPCNHPQKFPHPQVLLQHYLQGSTAMEAYWRSVAWPQQGLFIGEPLAAPFGR